jgi:dipeptidyl aminopeptidase/acylaminoacyl peptidase
MAAYQRSLTHGGLKASVGGFGIALLTVVPMSMSSQAWAASGPSPLCGGTPPGPIAGEPPHAGDGVPDPEGRIVFGQISRNDDLFGQVVHLYAIDADGSDVALLLDCDTAAPRWSPDGTKIAFTLAMDDGSWQVATIAPDGTDLHVLTSGSGIFEAPTWGPDSTWMIIDASPSIQDPADPAFHTTLWRMDADGTHLAEIGDPEAFDVEPSLSADGTEVVFARLLPEEDWASRLTIRDLATGAERVVLSPDRSVGHPAWVPNGGIAYNTWGDDPTVGLLSQIEVMPADDPSATPWVPIPATTTSGDYKASYRQDGLRLVFGCNTVSLGINEDGMCLMDADGSNVAVLRDEPGISENHFSWGMPVR